MKFRLMSDYEWQLKCLESRLQHPEWYEQEEDVAEAVRVLKKYLAHNKTPGCPERKKKNKSCARLVYIE